MPYTWTNCRLAESQLIVQILLWEIKRTDAKEGPFLLMI
jgi:hypothetical protein